MMHYDITFKGYRRYCNKAGLPHYSGIYMVYVCTYNKTKKMVTLKKLIYIGQAEDLNRRINNHEKDSDFLGQCKDGEQVCYAYAGVDKDDLDIVENALIFLQKPILNVELKDEYKYESAVFRIDGACSLLKLKEFSIE